MSHRAKCIAAYSLAAVALGWLQLGSKDVWLDEAASAGFALGPPESWIADHNMALYYALLGGWVRAFGHDPLALRSLSVLCFVASVPLFYLLAEALFTPWVARSATALYVTNMLLVHLAQEARGYMLAVLLVIGSQLGLVRLLERRRWRSALWLGLVQGSSVYAHLFAGLVALAQVGVMTIWAWSRPALPRWKLLAAYGLSAAVAAPLAVQAVRAGGAQVSWLYPPSLARGWGALVMWSGGSAALALAEVALCIAFVLREPKHPLARRLVVAWLFVPFAISFAISAWLTPIAHPKYLCVSVPALLLAAAAGLERIPASKLRVGALVALLLLSGQRLHFWYAHYQKERWNEVVSSIATQQRPGDALVLDVEGGEAFFYSAEQLGLSGHLPELWTRDSQPNRVWVLQNRSREFDAAKSLPAYSASWTRRFEPLDEDASSLFADSSGRIIQLSLLQR